MLETFIKRKEKKCGVNLIIFEVQINEKNADSVKSQKKYLDLFNLNQNKMKRKKYIK